MGVHVTATEAQRIQEIVANRLIIALRAHDVLARTISVIWSDDGVEPIAIAEVAVMCGCGRPSVTILVTAKTISFNETNGRRGPIFVSSVPLPIIAKAVANFVTEKHE